MTLHLVIPAKAKTQGLKALRLPLWVPAFAGMTKGRVGTAKVGSRTKGMDF